MDPHVQKILEFLNEIGLNVVEREILDDTFLPGITATDGALVVDFGRLGYPGDLLHEAGHLAQLSEAERKRWSGDFTDAEGYELGAIAWSYAASVHLGLSVEVVFHKDGYKGDAEWLGEQFAAGSSIGVPMLEWKGMTSLSGIPTYPKMQSWLCSQE